jgi:hypothetical protein
LRRLITFEFTTGPPTDIGWHFIDDTCDHRLALDSADRRAVQPVVIRQPDWAADTVSLTPRLCRTFSTVS